MNKKNRAKPPTVNKPAFKYKPQYGVVVICASEAEQQGVYRRLLADGLVLKVVTV